MSFRAPLGISDFRKLREAHATYVDKTSFVSEILRKPTEVVLLPRPRRFGKTLNLSTLRWFVERGDDDRRALFEGLDIAKDPEAQVHFQRYPVIFVTFKDVKCDDWTGCLSKLGLVLSKLYAAHRSLLNDGVLTPHEAATFEAIDERRADATTMGDALAFLGDLLHRRYSERVVILIDEYDTPIHAGYLNGYRREVVGFFRDLLSGAFKDNPHLFKGVITGILRVAKESIFSGLNNLAVYSLLHSEHASAFGFTEADVRTLAESADALEHIDEIRTWYDGYLFGGQVVYNPWSVLRFLAGRDKRFEAHWAGTSANDLMRSLLVRGTLESADVEALLRGEAIERSIDENVDLETLMGRPNAVWGLLLFTGYLTATEVHYEGTARAALSIPNREVETIYRTTFEDWMNIGFGGENRVQGMLRALLAGDGPEFGRALQALLTETLSYHDTGGRRPERVYHAFVAGLLVHLAPSHDVRSNRESGFGRCDVLVLPRQPGAPGVALELKTVDEDETPAHALDAALAQIRDRDYASELRARGAAPIHEIAAAFDGKRVRVAVQVAAPPRAGKVGAEDTDSASGGDD